MEVKLALCGHFIQNIIGSPSPSYTTMPLYICSNILIHIFFGDDLYTFLNCNVFYHCSRVVIYMGFMYISAGFEFNTTFPLCVIL